jgi:hypothetical protein
MMAEASKKNVMVSFAESSSVGRKIAPKILIFFFILCLQGYSTLRKSSQMSVHLRNLSPSEEIINDIVAAGTPWKLASSPTNATSKELTGSEEGNKTEATETRWKGRSNATNATSKELTGSEEGNKTEATETRWKGSSNATNATSMELTGSEEGNKTEATETRWKGRSNATNATSMELTGSEEGSKTEATETRWKGRSNATNTTKNEFTSKSSKQGKQRNRRQRQRNHKLGKRVEDTDFKSESYLERVHDKTREVAFSDNITHFFSHIPKTGAEYAHTALLKMLKSSVRLPGNRTLSDVMLAQKRFNQDVFTGDFFASNKEMDFDNFPIDLTGETDAYTPPFICNQATTEFRKLPPYYVGKKKRVKLRYSCHISVSEQPWNAIAQNVYTIVREPFSHILSQYFHCSESIDHSKPKKDNNGTIIDMNRQDKMPSLDEWLESWVNFTKITDGPMSEPKRRIRIRERLKTMRLKFKCYNPVDSESEFTVFNVGKLPDDYTYPYPNAEKHGDRDKNTKELDDVLFQDLKQRFSVIGDMAQMDKTMCAIFIDYTQGKHIPSICDCSNLEDGNESDEGGTFCLRDLFETPLPEMSSRSSCPVKMGYDSSNRQHSHGVKHHGSSFVKELTDVQRGLIATLRKTDLILYNVSRAVFEEQVRDLEAMYEIRICDKFNRVSTLPQPSDDPTEAPEGEARSFRE